MRLTAALAAMVLVVAAPAAADRWYEHYDRAERALAEERWAEAVSELNEALARRGDSAAVVRSYGLNTVEYLPYLKLGLAYFHLGRYEAALAALETEERLGEIREAPGALAELENLRRRAQEALDASRATAEARSDEAVARSLSEAELLAEAGRFDEAMQAVARALSVEPDNAAATARMAELRRRSVAAADLARRRQEGADLALRARSVLEANDPGAAASLLRQALELRDDPADRRLLEQTEAALRQAASRDRVAESVEAGLAEAASLEAAGDLDGAAAALGRVLALAPENARAASMQDRLAAARRAGREAALAAGDLGAAQDAFGRGRWEEAIAAANRVLARDAGSPEALELIGRAYRELSRQVLGGAAEANLPPAIRFADLRDDDGSGEPVQVVREPAFRLSGVVIDASPVRLEASGRGDTVEVTRSVQSVGGWYLTEFRVGLELEVGETTLGLTATDAEGASSYSEYRVRYRRPAWRSPWAVGGVVVLLGGVVAALAGVRAARRRRLRRRRFNPYVAGAPILDEELFYGREALIQRILQTVHHNSLLLHGERRIGKTSLQHHLKRRLEALEDPEYRFFPVFVDLQGTPESRFFATLASEVFSELETQLGGLRPAADLAGDYQDRELVADLRAVLSRLVETTPKRVKLVLLIDEVDELNAYDPRINQRLRGLFMKRFAESLVAVVSGVKIRREWEHEGSPWYNFFEEIEVSGFDREAASRLVTEPVRGVFRFDDDAVEEILERTGGRPYAIQKLCMAIVHRLHEEGRTRVTRAEVDAVAPNGEPGP